MTITQPRLTVGVRVLSRSVAIAAMLTLALLEPAAVVQAARQSCRVWAESVMPALFPFVTLSLMLVSGLSSSGMTGSMLTGFSVALGMLGGSPTGSKLILQLRDGGGMSPRAAQCAAACATTASPMFILATLTAWLNTDRRAGLIMLASHLLGALMAGGVCLVWTRRWPRVPLPYYSTHDSPRDTPKPISLGDAAAQAAAAMLTVCGCMILFNAAVTVAAARFNLQARPAAMLACVLEMAGGCSRIAGLGLPVRAAAPLATAAATFGGASVFTQNAAFLSKAGVNLSIQLAARLVAAAFAWMICAALLSVYA